MGVPLRPTQTLPGAPATSTERGVRTGLTTRIVLVGTVVLGQLWALTVALEAALLDHDGQAWVLAAFSLASFALVAVLALLEPAPRAGRLSGRLSGRAATQTRGYVPPPVGPSRSLPGLEPTTEAAER